MENVNKYLKIIKVGKIELYTQFAMKIFYRTGEITQWNKVCPLHVEGLVSMPGTAWFP